MLEEGQATVAFDENHESAKVWYSCGLMPGGQAFLRRCAPAEELE